MRRLAHIVILAVLSAPACTPRTCIRSENRLSYRQVCDTSGCRTESYSENYCAEYAAPDAEPNSPKAQAVSAQQRQEQAARAEAARQGWACLPSHAKDLPPEPLPRELELDVNRLGPLTLGQTSAQEVIERWGCIAWMTTPDSESNFAYQDFSVENGVYLGVRFDGGRLNHAYAKNIRVTFHGRPLGPTIAEAEAALGSPGARGVTNYVWKSLGVTLETEGGRVIGVILDPPQ
jgi:hypothetical protein